MTTRDSLLADLAQLDAGGLRRTPRRVRGPQGPEIEVDGRRAINFSSNNYLGLADHPALRAAALRATEVEGFGAAASRLISGNLEAHRDLEQRLASWQGTEAALLFNSGYQANVGILSALAGPEDAIISDRLNHASLIDGARLARAPVSVVPHRDLGGFERALRAARGARRRFLVTDSFFSMDGDRAPIAAIGELAHAHDALFLVDEAHAVGIFGPSGRGLGATLPIDLRMGTFGKAFGGFGAFVAADAQLIQLLTNQARSFVFTTALPVPVVAWARAAIDLVSGPAGDERRARLASLVDRFCSGLRALGLPAPDQPGHVVPLIVGDARRTMALSEALLARGVFAQGVRPPTVAPGTSRLRFALMATHRDDHIDAALDALHALRRELP